MKEPDLTVCKRVLSMKNKIAIIGPGRLLNQVISLKGIDVKCQILMHLHLTEKFCV